VGRRGDLPRIYPGLFEPAPREIDAAGPGVVHDVPRDVRELQGDAQIGGTQQGRSIAHTHDVGHHDAHDSGDVIAIPQGVVDIEVAMTLDVHRETFDQLHGVAFGDAVMLNDSLEGHEDGRFRRLAGEGAARSFAKILETLPRRPVVVARRAAAEVLQIDAIVAVPAPGVEHPGAVARLGCQKT
jgi:hypothetical protein